MRGRRILVTGGAGFIGGHLVARLLERGADVRVVDDLSTGAWHNIDRAGLTRTAVHRCDIRGPAAAAVVRGFRPDVVIHLAAQTSLPEAERTPLLDADINIRGTVNLLSASVDAGVGHVVYAASSAIYGNAAAGGGAVTENTECRPTGTYGRSKLDALRLLGDFRIRSTALVLGNVYGLRRATGRAGVIAEMADAVLRGRPPVIFGSGQQVRDFVHVDDVVRAVVRVCETGRPGTVNIGSGVGTTVEDVLALVWRAAGRHAAPERRPARDGEVSRMVLDIRRAFDLLGWWPLIGLPEGIEAVVAATSRDLHLVPGSDLDTFLAG